MIRDLSLGNLMIVSDLHGNAYDFRQILKLYKQLKKSGKADYLVFLGDLIHAYPGKQKDESLEMVLQLLEMGANKPESDIICLLGNHEFVHIYHIALQKGTLEFTTWFENRIRQNREIIIRFFASMPLMIRTKGGVLINHTGASDRYGVDEEFNLQWLKNYPTSVQFQRHLENITQFNPQIGAEFMSTKEGDYLWDVFMNGNERQYGESYLQMVDNLLDLMSQDRLESPLKTLVSGHIGVNYGAENIGEHQLRICTSTGCLRDLEKKLLLISTTQEYQNSTELLKNCKELF
ncbi:metallophosphoesterase [Ancylomarina longa]|uniref:Calcineurin-like phosphoesterase domain-containing protein n=1 Tax=Ancylomarina longa TaxID=2487017 RepID=A0A434AV39_9BACT|nr:metallophosphoesterase [Ancylomarina longa]RUT78217.1 hypothetical protein DLK05_09060 [Ancylomarina longa]